MTGLHDTHTWGERTHRGVTIPYCTACRVDGYEDEPPAFDPCPGAPDTDCGVTMQSWDNPGHVHVCGVPHDTGDHHCRECGFWFHPGSALREGNTP